jgi:hypothetical protein
VGRHDRGAGGLGRSDRLCGLAVGFLSLLGLRLLVAVGAAAEHAPGSLLSGWASDTAIRRGAASPRVRKAFVPGAVAGAAPSVDGASFAGHAWSPPGLFAAGFRNGAANPIVVTIGQALAGPRAGGRCMGVQNMFGQLAGIGPPIPACERS